LRSGTLAVKSGHAAERPLIDLAVLGPREGHAVVLELVDRGRRFAAEIFDRVLVAEPIGALDGVVHVPTPVILAHIAERSSDAALGGNRVAACREHFRNAGGLQSRLARAERRTQPGA